MTLQDVMKLAKQLSSIDKKRLIEQLRSDIELDSQPVMKPRQSLWGICSDLDQPPSVEDIDLMRQEAWNNFPREDI